MPTYSSQCPNCGGYLGVREGLGAVSEGVGAIYGLLRKPHNTFAGQKALTGLLGCKKCGKVFTTCPFCAAHVASGTLQTSSEIRCTSCRQPFVVK